MRTRLWHALFGILSTVFGLAAGHLAASLLNPASSPVLAVGATVIDATPTPMKEWAIRTFGSSDKAVLIGSVLVVVLLLAGLAGLLARRRFVLGAALEVVLVLLAGAAVLTRPSVEALDVVPTLVTLVAGPAALLLLVRTHARAAAGREAGPETDGETGPETGPADREDGPAQRPLAASRRTVVVVSGLVALSAAALAGVGRVVGDLRSRAEQIALPRPSSPAPALPEGLEARYPEITPLQTSRGDFYRVDTRLDTPVVESEGWTLTVDGDVENELVITFEELLAMPMIERDITMTCVSNSVGGPYVGSARWLGVRLTDVLEMAGVGGTADQLLSTDFDGMTISTPLDLATDGRDAMIVVGMNGQPLPRAHGFPVRMIIPGLYGFISGTKWLTRLTLTTYDEAPAYWTDRGWDTDAPIKISARIDTPQALAQLDEGEVVIGGVAWAQQRGGVATVQVQIDGGPWQDAELGPEVNNDYWRQWFYRWDASGAGLHAVSARVVDGSGTTQTAVRAAPYPGGSSGVQSLQVTVV